MLFRSNDTATTEIYTVSDTLSLHDSLPIFFMGAGPFSPPKSARVYGAGELRAAAEAAMTHQKRARERPSGRQITGFSCLAHISGAIIAGLRTRSVQNG